MEIYRVAVWVRCAVLCCAKRLTTTCTWKQTCARANRAVLKPFFLVCDQTKIVSHTTQKVLKIYLKFTAAHQFLHARYFLFWYLMLFTSFSNEKKIHFIQNETLGGIFWDGCVGKKGMETYNNNKKPPTA